MKAVFGSNIAMTNRPSCFLPFGRVAVIVPSIDASTLVVPVGADGFGGLPWGGRC